MILNDCGIPVHPAANAVILIVADTGVVPVFVAVKAGIELFPDAGKPMAVLLFVQVNVVPATGPAKTTGLLAVPLHRI